MEQVAQQVDTKSTLARAEAGIQAACSLVTYIVDQVSTWS
jgi:hypothetical protein